MVIIQTSIYCLLGWANSILKFLYNRMKHGLPEEVVFCFELLMEVNLGSVTRQQIILREICIP